MQSVIFNSMGILILQLVLSIICAIVFVILAACKKLKKRFLFIPMGVGIFSIVALSILILERYFAISIL